MKISNTTIASLLKAIAAVLTLVGAYLTGDVALAALIGGAVQAVISAFGFKLGQDAQPGTDGAAKDILTNSTRPKAEG